MSFTEKFQNYVCDGDSIDCCFGGFDVRARIVRDDSTDRPDQRQDGFWPSKNPKDAGFVGGGPQLSQRFDADQAQADAVMTAWKDNEWFYCGIVLSISRAGVMLDDHAASLWGIEANYPTSNNAYLNMVAGELLGEAIEAGQTALARLMAAIPTNRPDDILIRQFHNNAAGWIGGINNAPLTGQDGYRFSAIFDEDGAPVIIERRLAGDDGSDQIMPPDPDFEEISIRLIRLWDAVKSGTA